MNTLSCLQRVRCDDGGAIAVEFVLLAPVFLAILFGSIALSMLAFTFVGLHNAVEEAARCAAVKTACVRTNSADTAAATTAYAQAKFVGLGVTPVFAYTPASCGSKVTGTVTYVLDTGLYKFSIPLTATACYP
jgi:Flp pilus assembly protein TadG